MLVSSKQTYLNVLKLNLFCLEKNMPFDDQPYKLMIGDETIERIGLGCKEKYF